VHVLNAELQPVEEEAAHHVQQRPARAPRRAGARRRRRRGRAAAVVAVAAAAARRDAVAELGELRRRELRLLRRLRAPQRGALLPVRLVAAREPQRHVAQAHDERAACAAAPWDLQLEAPDCALEDVEGLLQVVKRVGPQPHIFEDALACAAAACAAAASGAG
jgi:hypothetical protein